MSQGNAVSAAPVVTKASTPAYAWVVLWITYFSSVVAAMDQLKVAPLMPKLQEVFHFSLSGGGFTMSVFAIAGVILALPGGVVIQKLGIKATGIIAMLLLIIGSSMGAVSTNFQLFLASRVIEGAGLALSIVMTPTAIALWFPHEKLAMPMGIFSTWISIGGFIVMAIAPKMTQLMNWQSVWWLCTALAVVELVLIAAFVRMPPAAPVVAGAAPQQHPSMGEAFAGRSIWLVAFLWLFYGTALNAALIFYPSFLIKMRGYSPVAAGGATSFGYLALVVGSMISGTFLAKMGKLKNVITSFMAAFGVLSIIAFSIPNSLVIVWWIALGIVCGFLAATNFTVVPGVMAKPELAGLGIALVILASNAAGLISPPVFGAIVEKSGWNAGAYFLMVPVIVLGIICVRFTKFTELR